MSSFFKDGKKLILLGFVVILLFAIPITVYIAQKQQQIQSHASKSTTLSFMNQTPNPASPNQQVSIDLWMDPGSNLVISATLALTYDATKLSNPSLTSSGFPSTVAGPSYTSGTIFTTLSTGSSVDQAINKKTKIATITFTPTGNGAAAVGFDTTKTTITSASDSETNVLSSATPGLIIIGNATATPTVTSSTITTAPAPTSPAAIITATPTIIPTPIGTQSASGPTPIPYVAQTVMTPTAAPTPIPFIPVPKPGPGDHLIKAGTLGAIVSVIGVTLFFSL